MNAANLLTNPENFIDLNQILLILIVFAEFFYLIIAFIMIRQVSLMNNSFTTKLAPIFSSLAKLHFVAAAVLLLFTILVF